MTDNRPRVVLRDLRDFLEARGIRWGGRLGRYPIDKEPRGRKRSTTNKYQLFRKWKRR